MGNGLKDLFTERFVDAKWARMPLSFFVQTIEYVRELHAELDNKTSLTDNVAERAKWPTVAEDLATVVSRAQLAAEGKTDVDVLIENLINGYVRLNFSSEQRIVPMEVIKLITSSYLNTQQITLKVSKHKGHADAERDPETYHPRNLLDGKDDTAYGGFSEGRDNKDWIEFMVSEEAMVIPTKIRIRNSDGDSAIKKLSLSIGTGDGSWQKLIFDIEDIEDQKETEQEFVFGELLVTPQWILKNDAKYIRLEVRENVYGRNNNFFEFRLFGVLI